MSSRCRTARISTRTAPAEAAAWYAVSSVADDRGPGRGALPAGRRELRRRSTARSRVRGGRGASTAPLAAAVAADGRLRASRAAAAGRRTRRAPRGRELAEAFRIVHDELGIEAVRAHAILHDSLGVYRDSSDEPVHDFTEIDAVLDRVLDTGLRPIVELSFMPRDLAADPDAPCSTTAGSSRRRATSSRWAALVRDLVAHLVDRYGRDEVRALGVRGLERAEPARLLVGDRVGLPARCTTRPPGPSRRSIRRSASAGPATAAVGWIDDLLEHCRADGRPARLRRHPHLRHAAARPPPDHAPGTTARTCRCGGPSGASADATAP